MKKARYICLEGTEGVGKTTQCNAVYTALVASGYKVLLTKEPGTPYSPLTMILRTIMLDKQYDAELTLPARELISQAIRSIHLEKVIYPAYEQYDFIIQDRGMLSGLSYGTACGNSEDWINSLQTHIVTGCSPYELYDDIIYLKGSVSAGLEKALSAKQEFEAGDAIEAKGVNFMHNVSRNMDSYATRFRNVKYIPVDGKSIEQVTNEILQTLDVGTFNGQEIKEN